MVGDAIQGAPVSAPAEMLAMCLHHERGLMIVDDLLALPMSPLTIAEGTPVTLPVASVGSRRLPVPGVLHPSMGARGARTRIRAFSCECGWDGCEEQVELAIADFPEPPDTTGHSVP